MKFLLKVWFNYSDYGLSLRKRAVIKRQCRAVALDTIKEYVERSSNIQELFMLIYEEMISSQEGFWVFGVSPLKKN
jgi:hypothetical protein